MICEERIVKVGDALYRVSKRISQERKVDFESATIRFLDLESDREFAYDTEMFASTYTAHIPDWDKDMWCAFIRAGIRYYQRRSKFSIDKIDTATLTAADGAKHHVIFM